MSSSKKSEYIPLLESDQHDWIDNKDDSSNFASKNFDYGSNKDHTKDRPTSVDNISDQDSEYGGDSEEMIKQVFGDFNTVSLSWANISCYAPGTVKGIFGGMKDTKLFKQLLFGVSGVVRNGTLMAIMGASGAGKSTLLNVLTCRNLGKMRVDGEVRINGLIMHSNIKRISAYVQQLDVFYGRLKVREHLLYNAILRMGKKYSESHILERINTLIVELGLSSCEDEYINSNSYHRQGLAGSEKKLLSIACELLCDPPIIFLDEPTTGLDSKMAEKVLVILRKLSQKGKCIICTIHQPSSLIYRMFNLTYLLAEGRFVFQGNRQQALEFFSDCGFPCDDNFNPADHFIHTMAIKPGRENDCRSKVIYLARKFQDTAEFSLVKKDIISANKISEPGLNKQINQKLNSVSVYKASYWQEIKTQIWKQGLDRKRDWKLFFSRIIQNFISTLILSLMTMQQKYDQIGVTNINGGLFSIVNNVSFLAIVQLSSFMKELKHHNIEHQSGICRSGSFFVAKAISDLPLFLINTAVCTLLFYWTIGLTPGFIEFVIFYVTILLVYQFSFSLNVLLVGSVVDNLRLGLTISALTVNIMMLMSGFLINDSTIPIYFKWLSYISCQRFGFEILTVNQWRNIKQINCTGNVKDSCYNSGVDVIRFLSFSESGLVYDFALLIGIMTLFKFCSLICIIIKGRERKLN